jgi:hypothetical protein
MSLGDDLIDVIAHDAVIHAPLESETRRLDGCQDHWTRTFGTGMEPNCYAARIKQDCQGRHDTRLRSGESATELSVTGGCR